MEARLKTLGIIGTLKTTIKASDLTETQLDKIYDRVYDILVMLAEEEK